MRPDAMTKAEAEAIDWLIRQKDASFADWDSFAEWLEQDAAHSRVFDEIAAVDLDLDAMPAPVSAAAETRAARPAHGRRWFGAAIAAALVGALSLGVPALWNANDQIVTAAGEQRVIRLGDGSRIELNGGSTIEIDPERPRHARLVSGEAMFHVVHKSDAPFVVSAGDARIVDLGTAFNVVRTNGRTRVAVSEGIVAYEAGRNHVRVAEGFGLDVRDDAQRLPAARPLDISSVGGWRSGLLVYNGAPLATVVEDLKRTTAVPLSFDPEVADVEFRGALVIDEDRSRTIADLAALSGTRIEQRGEGWHITQ